MNSSSVPPASYFSARRRGPVGIGVEKLPLLTLSEAVSCQSLCPHNTGMGLHQSNGERAGAIGTKMAPLTSSRSLRYRGRLDVPMRNSSTARAHCRPSLIAQTTRD